MSRSFKGVDPPLERTGREGKYYPRFFTLDDAKILGFEPAHDPDHRHKGDSSAWSSDPLEYLGCPEVIDELDGLDLAEQGFWGGPQGGYLLQGGQLEPDFLPLYNQNRHGNKGTPGCFYGSLGS